MRISRSHRHGGFGFSTTARAYARFRGTSRHRAASTDASLGESLSRTMRRNRSISASDVTLSSPGGPTTMTTSPRMEPDSPDSLPVIRSPSSCKPPVNTSSWTLVNSRQIDAGRFPPNSAARSASAAPRRAGDSKRTTVARISEIFRRNALRAPGRAGMNPANRNLSVGWPDTASAARTAEGPGAWNTFRSAWRNS